MPRVPEWRRPQLPARRIAMVLGGLSGQRGGAFSPTGSRAPARSTCRPHTLGAVCPALCRMRNLSVNRCYCYYAHFRDGQTDPENWQITQAQSHSRDEAEPGSETSSGLRRPLSSPQPTGRSARARLPPGRRQAILLSACVGPRTREGLEDPFLGRTEKAVWLEGTPHVLFQPKSLRREA